jgi:hypothetical protein
MNWTDMAQGIGSIAGALISLVGFYFVYKQIKQTNDNLRQSNHTAIYSINTDLYKFMAENSHLRPYFYDGKKPDDEHKNGVFSLSELLADFFEFILIEENSLSEEIRKPWANYRKMIYQKSPGFRRFLHENIEQYSDKMINDFWAIATSISIDNLRCQPVTNTADFTAIDQLYQSCFKESSIPTEVLNAWWTKQQCGLISLRNHDDIVGALSFWSLTQTSFSRLSSGQLKERELSADDLSVKNEGYIYISEIAISEHYLGKGYSFLLLQAVIFEVEKLFKSTNKKLSLLALGYSNEGKALLAKMNFKQILDASQTVDKQALYLLEIKSHEDIKNIIKVIL